MTDKVYLILLLFASLALLVSKPQFFIYFALLRYCFGQKTSCGLNAYEDLGIEFFNRNTVVNFLVFIFIKQVGAGGGN